MKSHPIADVFPMLIDSLLPELVADIAAHGLRHPIVVFEGQILDGRNRFRACQLGGVKPMFTTFTGDWETACDLVVSENLVRRHLNPSQRAMAADKLARLRVGRPELIASKEAIKPATQAAAAEQLQVSRSAVQRARVVREQGVPELAKAVEDGQVKVSAAAEVAKLPKEEQRKVVADGPTAVRKAAAKATKPPAKAAKAAPAAHKGKDAASEAGSQLVTRLIGIVKQVEDTAQELASNKAAIPTDEMELAAKAVDRIKTGADWLRALIGGSGFSDEALSAWLAGGNTK